MKAWPLDMRHLIRNNLKLFRGIGNEGDPQYTLTSVLTGGGVGLAVAIVLEDGDESMGDQNDLEGRHPRLDGREGVLPEGIRSVRASSGGGNRTQGVSDMHPGGDERR